MQLTGQTRCAYCDMDLTKEYEKWLMLVVDHAVPYSVCKANQIPADLSKDYSNMVLACATCNGFCNRYKPSFPITPVDTDAAFYALRDKILEERRKLIAERREDERKFFNNAPWKQGAGK